MRKPLHSFNAKGDFRHHFRYYVMEGFGLAIFMVSACYFTALLEAPSSYWHSAIPDGKMRLMVMSLAMGLTALFIFYSPITSPSGAHINPAVTIARLRLGQIPFTDACFYILFQLAGGSIAVYIMAYLLGPALREPPVRYAVTVPGKGYEPWQAAVCELAIAFIMFSMILFTSGNARMKKFTRVLAAILVASFVFISGPISGFGMNPARSFASALNSEIWTDFPIYAICPIMGMLLAAEVYILRFKDSIPKKR